MPRISTIISWTLKGVLFALFMFSTMANQFPLNLTVLLAVFVSISPLLISRRYDFNFPPLVDLVITFALLMDIIGRVFKLYHTVDYWWWDIMTHTLGTATIALLAFYLVFMLVYLKRVKISYWMMGVFTFSFAMMIGAIWEVFEFYYDRFTGYNTYFNSANSARDMLFDIIGGLFVAILGTIYTKRIMTKRSKRT